MPLRSAAQEEQGEQDLITDWIPVAEWNFSTKTLQLSGMVHQTLLQEQGEYVFFITKSIRCGTARLGANCHLCQLWRSS